MNDGKIMSHLPLFIDFVRHAAPHPMELCVCGFGDWVRKGETPIAMFLTDNERCLREDLDRRCGVCEGGCHQVFLAFYRPDGPPANLADLVLLGSYEEKGLNVVDYLVIGPDNYESVYEKYLPETWCPECRSRLYRIHPTEIGMDLPCEDGHSDDCPRVKAVHDGDL